MWFLVFADVLSTDRYTHAMHEEANSILTVSHLPTTRVFIQHGKGVTKVSSTFLNNDFNEFVCNALC